MKIQLKRSNILDGDQAKQPEVDQTEYGELCVNFNATDAALFIKDSSDNIRRVGGSIQAGSSAPDADTSAVDWYLDTSNGGQLYYRNTTNTAWYEVQAVAKFVGGDGIDISNTAGTQTVSVELAGGDDGLEFSSNKLTASIATTSSLGSVKAGNGLDVDGSGSLSIDISNPIAPAPSGSFGYWRRAGTAITTRTSGDDLDITGDFTATTATLGELSFDTRTISSTGAINLEAGGTGSINFKTKNQFSRYYFYNDDESYYGAISVNSLTSDRFYTLPDQGGTIALTSDIIPTATGTFVKLAGDSTMQEITGTGGLKAEEFQSTVQLTSPRVESTNQLTLEAGGTGRVTFKTKNTLGQYRFFTVDGSYYGNIMFENMTANRGYSFPDASGTVALTSDIPADSTYVKIAGDSNIQEITGSGGIKASKAEFGALEINSTEITSSAGLNLKAGSGQPVKLYSKTSVASYRLFNAAEDRYVNLKVENLTASRSFIFPDQGGTLAITTDIGAYVDGNYLKLTGDASAQEVTGSGGIKAGKLETGELEVETASGTIAKVEINEGTTTNPLRIEQNSTESRITTYASHPLVLASQPSSSGASYLIFETQGQDRMLIKVNGDVHIGGSSVLNNPNIKLSAVGAITAGRYNEVSINTGLETGTGTSNYFIGGTSNGNQLTTGSSNVGIASQAGSDLTTGSNNVAIGSSAGKSVTTGGANIAIGSQALENNTVGIRNICIGMTAGRYLEGSHNTIIGRIPGDSTLSHTIILAAGLNERARCNSSGNWLFGGTLPSAPNIQLNEDGTITAGTYNGVSITTGEGTGGDNYFFGGATNGEDLTSGSHNIGIGSAALIQCTEGGANIAIGSSALENNVTGDRNICIGRFAGKNLELGNNTIIGRIEGDSTLAATIILGAGSFERARCDSSGNWLFGGTIPSAPNIQLNEDGNITAGTYNDVYINTGAGTGVNNYIVGSVESGSNISTGGNNSAFGKNTLRELTTGDLNTAVGSASLTKITTASYNTAIGGFALNNNITGAGNTCVGYRAGIDVTGTNNTIIGRISGDSTLTDTIILGAGATERARCDSDGNWGLGTNDPLFKLHVVGVIGLGGGIGGADRRRWLFNESDDGSNSYLGIQSYAGGSWSDKLSIGSNGNLYIGGTIPSAPNILLNKDGNITAGSYNDVYISQGTGTGTHNYFVGNSDAGASLTTGSNNTGVGTNSMKDMTTGDSNTAVGYGSLANTTISNNNTAIGVNALNKNITGAHNTCVGNLAGRDLEGSSNTIIGRIVGDSTLSTTIILGAGATERIRCDSDGNWLIGNTTERSFSNGGTGVATPLAQININTAGAALGLVRDSNNSSGANIYFGKARGTSYEAINSGDTLGTIRFNGADGTQMALGAQIQCKSAGTVGTNSVPAKLIFSTTDVGNTNSSERMIIMPNGNVGIGLGNSSDDKKLAVKNGMIHLSTSANDGSGSENFISLGRVTAAKAGIGFKNTLSNGRGDIVFVNDNVDDATQFSLTTDEVMRIKSTGKVGIGTSNPSSKLSVSGNGSTSIAVVNTEPITDAVQLAKFLKADSNNLAIYSSGSTTTSTDTIFYSKASTETMRIVGSTGNVGIGTEVPNWKLDVANTACLRATTNDGSGGTAEFYFGKSSGPKAALQAINVASNGRCDLAFLLNNTNNSNAVTAADERVRITSSGNVGIGTTAPAEKLHVDGDIRADNLTDGTTTKSVADIVAAPVVASFVAASGSTQSVDATTDTDIDISTDAITHSNFSNSSGEITVTDAGIYEVHCSLQVTATQSNYRWTGELKCKVNGTTSASVTGGYLRSSSSFNSYVDISHIVSLSASDVVKFSIKRVSTTAGNATTVDGMSRIWIKKL